MVWGKVYNKGMKYRGTLRPLNKLALPQSPLQATQLKLYVYIVNFWALLNERKSVIVK